MVTPTAHHGEGGSRDEAQGSAQRPECGSQSFGFTVLVKRSMDWSHQLKTGYEEEVKKASVYLRILDILNEESPVVDSTRKSVSTLHVLQVLDELKNINKDEESTKFLTQVQARLQKINKNISSV